MDEVVVVVVVVVLVILLLVVVVVVNVQDSTAQDSGANFNNYTLYLLCVHYNMYVYMYILLKYVSVYARI